MNEQLIVLKQLPVIEEHLQTLSAQVDQRVDAALSMVVDETTYKSVKATRAELNKEFQELEERRKAVKASIMEPYDKFNSVYEQFAAKKYRRGGWSESAESGETAELLRRVLRSSQYSRYPI